MLDKTVCIKTYIIQHVFSNTGRKRTRYCIVLCIIIGARAQEPSCYTTNRFEYEFSVPQKLDSLEKETSLLHKKHTDLIEQVALLLAENKGTLYYVSVF